MSSNCPTLKRPSRESAPDLSIQLRQWLAVWVRLLSRSRALSFRSSLATLVPETAMASGTGGIDLLSMYNDEEEEEEQEELQPEAEAVEEQRSAADAIPLVPVADGGSGDASTYPSVEATPPSLGQTRSPLLDDGMDYETLSSPIARSPTPPPMFPSRLMSSPFAVVSPSPPPPPLQPSSSLPEPVDPQRMRMGSLAIVDYEHDEAAMSPTAIDEGEESTEAMTDDCHSNTEQVDTHESRETVELQGMITEKEKEIEILLEEKEVLPESEGTRCSLIRAMHKPH